MTIGEPGKKEGLSTLAWIAIGGGGLVAVGLIAVFGPGFLAVKAPQDAFTEATAADSLEELVQEVHDNTKAAAEAMIGINPDLEILSADDEAGTLTLRNNKTGEEPTLYFEEIAWGRFSMATDEANLEGVPAWVPIYPGATSTRSLYMGMATEVISGTLMSQTRDGAQAVIDHYTRVFEDDGYEIGRNLMTTNGSIVVAGLNGERNGRAIGVTASCHDGACLVTISYNGSHGGRRF